MNIISSVFLSASVLIAAPANALTMIDSLPFDCNATGETYQLSQDLTLSSGTAIRISADGITLDGNGHNIMYASGGPGYGVLIATTTTSLTIKNLTLQQGAYSPANGERVHAIYRNGRGSGIRIQDNTIVVRNGGESPNSSGFGIALHNTAESTFNIIRGNNIVMSGGSGGRGISIDGRWEGEIAENTIVLESFSNSPTGYPKAIYIIGALNTVIRENELILKASVMQAQGIALWNSDSCTIENNTIRISGTHARGILIDGDSDDNLVTGNYIVSTTTIDDGNALRGITIRFGSDRNLVTNNTINIDSPNGYALGLGGGNATHSQPAGNLITFNSLSARSAAVRIEDGADYSFANNDIIGLGTSRSFELWCGNNSLCDRIDFSFDHFEGPVRLTGANANSSSEILFCDTNLAQQDISVGTGNHEFSFSSSNCPTNITRPASPTELAAISE